MNKAFSTFEFQHFIFLLESNDFARVQQMLGFYWIAEKHPDSEGLNETIAHSDNQFIARLHEKLGPYKLNKNQLLMLQQMAEKFLLECAYRQPLMKALAEDITREYQSTHFITMPKPKNWSKKTWPHKK